nr:uncharacterized protein LOC129429827 [Misgurnus anguillicaudatus]
MFFGVSDCFLLRLFAYCIKGKCFLAVLFIALRPSISMDSKDAQETLERGGEDARCTCRGARRKVVAVLFIQSLLTATCAAISLWIFFGQTEKQDKGIVLFSPDKGIYLELIDKEKFTFNTLWNNSANLQHGKNVVVSCAGPYTVYMWANVISFDELSGTVNLTMLQGNQIVYQQTMQSTERAKVQSAAMLAEDKEITLEISKKESTDIKFLHIGLHYMLGDQCFDSP